MLKEVLVGRLSNSREGWGRDLQKHRLDVEVKVAMRLQDKGMEVGPIHSGAPFFQHLHPHHYHVCLCHCGCCCLYLNWFACRDWYYVDPENYWYYCDIVADVN
ncbi:unnamed protein product [Sphenostylis stenocarpa]|uniref:Uncharacterized protein n=1 Tax=Sphenostylis stenocarpa TaxID=92480 RepID=A0AA86VZJ7_9FABA|nr:unnamed protein product [Sphenostylis stenocarpa]